MNQMAEEFAKSVEDGLQLSKRLYYGKDRAVAPPKPVVHMEKSAESYLPTAPMVYAVISDPRIVDNPDLPSYQPHVHGRCDPPSLIPLQMNSIELQVESFLDSAVIRVNGSWRVHCVMGSKSCDCRIAIPMGEEGSILGVEVEVPRKSYNTELIASEGDKDSDKDCRPESGGFLTPRIFTLRIPNVDGGSNISIKLRWTQKLSYLDGILSLTVPFRFPEYVNHAVKKLAKMEKIVWDLNSVTGTEVLCKTSSHPLKQLNREPGKLCFLYEAKVLTWTDIDFAVSYSVSSERICGGMILQSPSMHDVDQREMFCFYLFPGDQPNTKVFRKEIVFVVDISGSMEGKPLEGMKNAISGALSKLDTKDSFNFVAFNGETYLFSSSMELATEKTVSRALEWMNVNLIAGGNTNISVPLNKAMEMVSNTHGSLPVIFLVTDGAVEDERNICNSMNRYLTGKQGICPRIYSFGIGRYCNHYFLRMLAMVSRGQYDSAYDVDSVESQMEKLFRRGLSTVLVNVTTDALEDLDDVEVYPSCIPDLSSERLLTVFGRYHGKFPETLKAKGVLGDLSNFVTDFKVQKAKDLLFDRIFAKQQIDLLTSQAWFSESKQLEEKVSKMSIQTGVVSEYTHLTLLEVERGNQAAESPRPLKLLHENDPPNIESKGRKGILLQKLGVGFGNLAATADNIPPGVEEPKLPESAELIIKAASDCCGRVCGHCCCMCCIQCCSKINDQCAIALTQLFVALSCFGCLECCSWCCSCADGQ